MSNEEREYDLDRQNRWKELDYILACLEAAKKEGLLNEVLGDFLEEVKYKKGHSDGHFISQALRDWDIPPPVVGGSA
jgi:hypothetical protein